MSRLLLVICCIMVISFSAAARLDSKPVYADEPAEEKAYSDRLSSDRALRDLERIESALKSFTRLTDASRSIFTKEKLKERGNTGSDVQTLDFMVWPGIIKGTILRQEYTIKRLQYDLSLKRFKLGEINKEEVSAAQKEYQKAAQKLQTFWNTFGVVNE